MAARPPAWATPSLVPLFGLDGRGLCRCPERLCKTPGRHSAAHLRNLAPQEWVARGHNVGLKPEASAGLIAISKNLVEYTGDDLLSTATRSPSAYRAGSKVVIHLFAIPPGDYELVSQTLAHGLTVLAGTPRFPRVVPFPPSQLPSGECEWLTADWQCLPPRVPVELLERAEVGSRRPDAHPPVASRPKATLRSGGAGRGSGRRARASHTVQRSTFTDLVQALEANGCAVSPGRRTAQCPAHKDRNPSLSIGEADDGTVLVFCHAGCAFDEVLEALGMVRK